ncbi:MAG: alcohol dehydrogenase catalytic domain-containing protein [Chloroflexota bacterium]
MSGKYEEYYNARNPIPSKYLLWPLYGAGFENMGKDGKPIEVENIEIGPDELLIRHDACGLCFSDIKVITQGQNHPRIVKDMKEYPVTLGHEAALTVVKVGANLGDQYKVGDRFIIQADIFHGGVSTAYGYVIQGGLSQYNILDHRVLKTDAGSNIIPIQPETGYAEGALVEPWACAVAAYRLEYRTSLKNGGTTWIIGAGENKPYTISQGFDNKSHPARLMLTDVPASFAAWLKESAKKLGVEVIEVNDFSSIAKESIDDIILLGANVDLIEKASPYLTQFGMMAIIADKPLARKASIDVGRIHYMRWGYVGGSDPDISHSYNKPAIRSAIKPGGTAWFVGAGGPIGRMHVQRAIQFADGPATIVATDVSNARLDDLYQSYKAEAEEKKIEFICLNPNDKEVYAAGMARFFKRGFDDVVVLAPIAPVIADAAMHLAPEGVMNVFAGVGKGTMVDLDVSDVYLKTARYIGHSGSTMDDFVMTLEKTESKELSPNRALAAIGSIHAAREGLQKVKEQVFPGKVVIYLNIKEMPLTSLPELKEKMPTVYAKMKDGREWTVEAEKEFLNLMLP